MKKSIVLPLLLLGASFQLSQAQVTSPIQAAIPSGNPYKLDIVDTVKLAGSDAASKNFQANILPSLIKVINSPLYAKEAKKNMGTIGLDPKQLTLSFDSTVRAYFLTEDTARADSLGIATNGDPKSKDAEYIFPDISSGSKRTLATPLAQGDFVDLGKYLAGDQLAFFLVNQQYGYVSTNTKLNTSKGIHVVSYATEGSTYLMLAFEDWPGGGDWDFNDFTMVLEFAKVQKISAPEPSLALGSVIAAMTVIGVRRRPRKTA